jgi:hypothetical protein
MARNSTDIPGIKVFRPSGGTHPDQHAGDQQRDHRHLPVCITNSERGLREQRRYLQASGIDLNQPQSLRDDPPKPRNCPYSQTPAGWLSDQRRRHFHDAMESRRARSTALSHCCACRPVSEAVGVQHDQDQLRRISLPTRHHSTGRLALCPVHPQLPRCRGSVG